MKVVLAAAFSLFSCQIASAIEVGPRDQDCHANGGTQIVDLTTTSADESIKRPDRGHGRFWRNMIYACTDSGGPQNTIWITEFDIHVDEGPRNNARLFFATSINGQQSPSAWETRDESITLEVQLLDNSGGNIGQSFIYTLNVACHAVGRGPQIAMLLPNTFASIAAIRITARNTKIYLC